jgi:hypothetical protein
MSIQPHFFFVIGNKDNSAIQPLDFDYNYFFLNRKRIYIQNQNGSRTSLLINFEANRGQSYSLLKVHMGLKWIAEKGQ